MQSTPQSALNSTTFTFTMSTSKSTTSTNTTYVLSTQKGGPAKILEFKPKGGCNGR